MRIETDDALALRQLIYDNRCGGPLNLYLLEAGGVHPGVQRFVQDVSDPREEISAAEARRLAEFHANSGGEVRITNADDLIVYHARGGSVIFPPAGRVEFFWERAAR